MVGGRTCQDATETSRGMEAGEAIR